MADDGEENSPLHEEASSEQLQESEGDEETDEESEESDQEEVTQPGGESDKGEQDEISEPQGMDAVECTVEELLPGYIPGDNLAEENEENEENVPVDGSEKELAVEVVESDSEKQLQAAATEAEEAAATAALQEEMRLTIASIPAGAGAAFTEPQKAELAQQSLIYRFMAHRVPVPTHLVFPIWKSVTGILPDGAQRYPTLMGLATLCLDFGKAPEPEPGRCRRTDGKKWRCWRNTIPNEKYCERHMHRGRKRPPVQVVVELDDADATPAPPKSVKTTASASAKAKAAKGAAAEGASSNKDDQSSSATKLPLTAPAAVEST